MGQISKFLVTAALAAFAVPGAAAAQVVLDFEGSSNSAPPGSTAISIDEFYNGGTDSGGTAGPDLGVSFTNANFDSFSAQAGLYNITSTIAYMTSSPLTVSTEFGFRRLAFDQFFFGGGNVLTAYDGANGTGNVLDTFTFGQNCSPNCTAASQSLSFSGIARSVTLAPNANGTGIDNLAFGGVPEPATWAFMIMGFGAIGGAMRRRKAATGSLVAA